MVPFLLEKLTPFLGSLNALHYITSRSILALLFSFICSLFLFPRFISWLRKRNIGQTIRDDGPESHKVKSGTPTMGGVILLFVGLGSAILWVRWDTPYLWIVVLHTLAFGLIGLTDDVLKYTLSNPKGLRGSIKLILSAAILFVDVLVLNNMGMDFYIALPFFKNIWVSTPFLVIPFIFIVVLGTANAANLTDGLDGLLAGILLIVLTTIGILCYLAGNQVIAEYLYIPYVAGAGELSIVISCLIGSLIGFLWFNCHPAAIFMGDSGSLSIGAALGLISVIIRHEFLLLICAGVIAMEALSVILQVSSYKLFKRRIFRMAPIHHHFELKGWHETQIIVRFWIISFLLSIITLITLKLR